MRKLGSALAVLVGLILGGVLFGSQAVAGDYTIKDCWEITAPSDDSTFVEAPAGNPGFTPNNGCPIVGNHFAATGATDPGDLASIRYEAPQGTGFLGARMWYYHLDANGVSARFLFNNAGGANTEQVTGLLPQGTLWAGPTFYNVSDGQPRSIFRGTLKCDRPVNPCGTGAGISIEKAELKMRDSLAPSSADFLSGTLFDPGTVSGVRTAFVGGIDNGSGVQFLSLNVNDVLTYAYGSTCDRAGLRPCPRDPTTTFNVDTGGANFVNGMNKITLCVQDYATTGTRNATCANRYINVAK